MGLAATLANGDFQFVDPTIRFTVANEVQFEELKECSTELLHFVRTHVGQWSIALEVEVSEVEAPAEFMTPKDRYVKWASEHPPRGHPEAIGPRHRLRKPVGLGVFPLFSTKRHAEN